jgi:hypothetical protein
MDRYNAAARDRASEKNNSLEEQVRVFHAYAGCPGIITAVWQPGSRWVLTCAECGKIVASFDVEIVDQIVDLIERADKPAQAHGAS